MPVSLVVLVFSLVFLVAATLGVVARRRLLAQLGEAEARLLAERAEREQVKGELVEHRKGAEARAEEEREIALDLRGGLERTSSELERARAAEARALARIAALEEQLGAAAMSAEAIVEERRKLTGLLDASRAEAKTQGESAARLTAELRREKERAAAAAGQLDKARAEEQARLDKQRAEDRARYERALAERLAAEQEARDRLVDEARLARDEAFREKNAKDSFSFEVRSIRGELNRLTAKLGEETALREETQQRLAQREGALAESAARITSLEAALKSWEPQKPGDPEPQHVSMWWCTDCDQGGLVTAKPHKCPPKKDKTESGAPLGRLR